VAVRRMRVSLVSPRRPHVSPPGQNAVSAASCHLVRLACRSVRKHPGKREWIAAAVLVSIIVTVGFVVLGLQDPRWGTDFWQRVLVSGLGTLGSVGLAVGLYYLKRKHDREDAQAAAVGAKQNKLHDDLLQMVAETMNIGRERPKDLYPGSIGLTVTLTGVKYLRFQALLTDPDLRRLCKINSEALLGHGWSVGEDSLKELHEGALGRFTRLTTLTLSGILAVESGKSIDFRLIEEAAQPPRPAEGGAAQVEESAGGQVASPGGSTTPEGRTKADGQPQASRTSLS
jgi:hypothetical protein